VNGDGHGDLLVSGWAYTLNYTWEGAAFVYHGSATGLVTTPAWSFFGDQQAAYLGDRIAAAGDVDSDGYDDIVVAAPWHDGRRSDMGKAYAFLGSSSGLSGTPVWSATGPQVGGRFGRGVAGADVNGDGYSDLVIGAYFHGNGEAYEGRVDAYHGPDLGAPTSPDGGCQ
jgi:hypothetical protein